MQSRKVLAGSKFFYGFALGGGQWTEHCWCMRGDLTIETTGEMVAYYGARLVGEQLQQLEQVCLTHNPLPAAGGMYWCDTHLGRIRFVLDSEKRTPHIGRRLDDETFEPLTKLGLE